MEEDKENAKTYEQFKLSDIMFEIDDYINIDHIINHNQKKEEN